MRVRLLIAVLLLVLTGQAAADEAPPERRAGIGRRAAKLVMSLGLQDLFRPEDVRRLQSGFSSRVLVRVALYRMGDDEPVAQAVRHTEIVYDLWDEKFRARRQQSTGEAPDVRETTDAQEAIDFACGLRAFAVANLNQLEPGVHYRLSVRADLNPISQELLADVRRWLARPTGRNGIGSGDSVFGSFVSIFVNPRIEDSERQLRVLSPEWVEPPR